MLESEYQNERSDQPKPLMVSYRFGSVGDARRMGYDAPLPGPDWVAEKDY